MMRGIGVKLPLVLSDTDGPYELTKTFIESINTNLKMLILTSPGERIMYPDFGVGIKRYLFEGYTSNVSKMISQSIMSQAKTYMPYLEINNINIYPLSPDEMFSLNENENYLFNIQVDYDVTSKTKFASTLYFRV